MTDHIKWTLNHLPPSEDSRLGIMSLENAAKARAFHRSFPQYAATPLTRLDGMAQIGRASCRERVCRYV